MKYSALIVHSKSSEMNAKRLALIFYPHKVGLLKDCFPREKDLPSYMKLRRKYRKSQIIAIGGGGVIDIAKIIAYPRRCIAYPQTAAGSSQTSTASVWGEKKKITMYLKKPVDPGEIKPALLRRSVREATMYDCLAHIVESLWSKRKTKESVDLALRALLCLKKHEDDQQLIIAGQYAGQAIEITKTNIIHALSYPLTIRYRISHGRAIAMVFHETIKFMDYPLPELPEFRRIKIPDHLNVEMLAKDAIQYKKIQYGTRKVTKEDLIKILRRCQ